MKKRWKGLCALWMILALVIGASPVSVVAENGSESAVAETMASPSMATRVEETVQDEIGTKEKEESHSPKETDGMEPEEETLEMAESEPVIADDLEIMAMAVSEETGEEDSKYVYLLINNSGEDGEIKENDVIPVSNKEEICLTINKPLNSEEQGFLSTIEKPENKELSGWNVWKINSGGAVVESVASNLLVDGVISDSQIPTGDYYLLLVPLWKEKEVEESTSSAYVYLLIENSEADSTEEIGKDVKIPELTDPTNPEVPFYRTGINIILDEPLNNAEQKALWDSIGGHDNKELTGWNMWKIDSGGTISGEVDTLATDGFISNSQVPSRNDGYYLLLVPLWKEIEEPEKPEEIEAGVPINMETGVPYRLPGGKWLVKRNDDTADSTEYIADTGGCIVFVLQNGTYIFSIKE